MPNSLYAQLQCAIAENPAIGMIIPGSGGLRKVRWKLAGSGKRGEKSPGRIFAFSPKDIKEIRQKLGLSQQQFSKLTYISVRTLQNWEQGITAVPTHQPKDHLTDMMLPFEWLFAVFVFFIGNVAKIYSGQKT